MADRFDIHLNEDQARRLKAAAEASGVDPETYLLQAMNDGEEARRWAEYQRTGETIPLEDALAAFDAQLRHNLAQGG